MFPLPKTLKQLRAFLGVTGYYRIWILGYVDLARPLYQTLKDDKSENAFYQLKKALNSSSPGSPGTGQVSIICL
jgi:hypothetical protein